MDSKRTGPTTFEEYAATFPPRIRAILRRIRATIRKAAPAAEERISYRMPAFRLHGELAYFAAFKHHIGFFPPVQGDDALLKAVSVYAGPKGNLRFPLDAPIPYALIERIVKQRVKHNERAMQAKAMAKSRKRTTSARRNVRTES